MNDREWTIGAPYHPFSFGTSCIMSKYKMIFCYQSVFSFLFLFLPYKWFSGWAFWFGFLFLLFPSIYAHFFLWLIALCVLLSVPLKLSEMVDVVMIMIMAMIHLFSFTFSGCPWVSACRSCVWCSVFTICWTAIDNPWKYWSCIGVWDYIE